MAASIRITTFPLLAVTLLALIAPSQARTTQNIYGTDANGVTRGLAVDRYPLLYTGDFGDCLGGQSLFNVTRFDTGYYADNLTIVFHLDGTSNIKNDSLMMHLSIDAYGKPGLEMTLDPCHFNITSLCPLNASRPITGWAAIPVTAQQVSGIPDISFYMPDLEGSAKLQIFSNSSRTQIGCFQAVIQNGSTFSHPEAVAPVLATFIVIAITASFITSAYGVSVPHIRMHHAHSLSVLVVFETLHYIFFSGALSVSWPSVLIGWWGNFAWSAGQIYSSNMIRGLNSFTGINGNASQVGGAGSTVIANGGGLITSIYGRSVSLESVRRAAYDESNPYDYTWAGNPTTPGMPTPGSWSGFAGNLAGAYIPAADAFILGLIWFVVALGLVALFVMTLKAFLESLVRLRWIEEDKLSSFRQHWVIYLRLALQRAIFIGFFMMTTLAMYQLSIDGSKGATATAAVVLALFLIGATGSAIVAIRARTRLGKFEISGDQIVFHQTRLFKVLPLVIPRRSSTLKERDIDVEAVGTLIMIPFFRIRHINDHKAYPTVHQDEEYLKKFGWLTAKYRRTRWWFFAYHAGYQFVRACFLGGATMNPMAQVYGLLIVEIIAFIVILQLNPWEGSRNTSMAVYMLSISKILTTALSISFLPALSLDRMTALALGTVMIAIQCLLVAALLVLIVLSAVSSWFSLTRNQQEFEPDWLDGTRVKYFTRMEAKAPDRWLPPKPKEDVKGKGKAKATDEGDEEGKRLRTPGLRPNSARTVRKAPRIEEEETDVVNELEMVHNPSVKFDTNLVHGPTRSKRASSVSSRHSVSSLRKGNNRQHRASWSQFDAQQADRPDSIIAELPRVTDGSTQTAGSGVLQNGVAATSLVDANRASTAPRGLETNTEEE